MKTVTYEEFLGVEIRVGTVVRAEPFPEARNPAIKLFVDFGPEIGVKQSSSQITVHYTPDAIIGRQVLGCLNLGTRKVAGFKSEFLTLGLYDENNAVILAGPDKPVPNGARLL